MEEKILDSYPVIAGQKAGETVRGYIKSALQNGQSVDWKAIVDVNKLLEKLELEDVVLTSDDWFLARQCLMQRYSIATVIAITKIVAPNDL